MAKRALAIAVILGFGLVASGAAPLLHNHDHAGPGSQCQVCYLITTVAVALAVGLLVIEVLTTARRFPTPIRLAIRSICDRHEPASPRGPPLS